MRLQIGDATVERRRWTDVILMTLVYRDLPIVKVGHGYIPVGSCIDSIVQAYDNCGSMTSGCFEEKMRAAHEYAIANLQSRIRGRLIPPGYIRTLRMACSLIAGRRVS